MLILAQATGNHVGRFRSRTLVRRRRNLSKRTTISRRHCVPLHGHAAGLGVPLRTVAAALVSVTARGRAPSGSAGGDPARHHRSCVQISRILREG
jgi:hypothetical protein